MQIWSERNGACTTEFVQTMKQNMPALLQIRRLIFSFISDHLHHLAEKGMYVSYYALLIKDLAL